MFKKVLLVLIMGSFIGSCDIVKSNDDLPSDMADGLIKVDISQAVAVIKKDPYTKVVFNVPFEIKNRMSTEIYMVGCMQAPPPVLQKYVLGKWVDVYQPVILDCLSPPFIIEPGETFRDILRVEGYAPGQNTYPVFEADIDGTYRLVQKLYINLDKFDSGNMEDGLLPIEERISNTFTVKRK